MMWWMIIQLAMAIAAIGFAFICSLTVRSKPLALRFLCIWLGVTFLTELVAAYCNYRYHFNLSVYAIMGPVMLFFSALYFNYSSPNLRKWHIGWIVGILGIIFTIVNTKYFQPLNTLNTNFTSFECVCLCALSVGFLYSLYAGDKMLTLNRNPYFWIAALFFVFYAGTFLVRAGIEILKNTEDHKAYSIDLYYLVFYLAIIFYAGIGVVLLKFNKYGK